jgi:RNA polymerase sigma factor (sigma-70 family)
MIEPRDFSDLIRLVRTGDQNAAAELVRQFEPFVMRFVRFRMRRRADRDRLGPQVGASDICQSVLQSFFQHLRSGRYDLTRPVELEKLLKSMARLHIASKARNAGVILRRALGDDWESEQAGSSFGPEKDVDDKDFLEAVLKHLSTDELEILVQKVDGKTWGEIAAGLGSSEDAVRKKLVRATQRVRDRIREAGVSTI